jgi:hypothetical protein
MSLPRRTTEKIRHALKIATKRTVQACGSQDSAASITRVGPKTLSDYGNTGEPRHAELFMPVDVLADLIIDCREGGEVAPLLETLCELAGGRFVPVTGSGRRDLVETIMRAAVQLHGLEETQDAAE